MKQAMTPLYTPQSPQYDKRAQSGMITLTAGLMMMLLLGMMVLFAGCTPPKPKVERENLFHDPLQMFNGIPMRMTYEDLKQLPPVTVSREKAEHIRKQVRDRLAR